MWKKLLHEYKQFIDGEPGRRFFDAYSRWGRGGKRRLTTIAAFGGGVVLVAMGSLLALVPGVPGVILGVLGLALIATRSRKIATGLDWLELKCRKTLRSLKHPRAVG